MIREQKRAALLKEKRASIGSTSPPSVIVLFGLSASVNLNSLAEDLSTLLSAKGVAPTVASSEYKLRTTVLKASHGDLLSCMEMAKESLPPEYARIFACNNFTRTQKHVLAKALDMEQEGVDECIPASSYARLHIKEVSTGIASKLCMLAKTMPILACGLLQHESKISVLHFSVKKHDTYTVPIKANVELVFHVGFRQFVCRPIFSSDNLNSDKHKMERFLHPVQFSIASINAPICFPPLPLIVLKCEAASVSTSVAAIGSLRSVDADRIMLKKIILTGSDEVHF